MKKIKATLAVALIRMALIGCKVRIESWQLERASDICKDGIVYLHVADGGSVSVTCNSGMTFPVLGGE